MEGIINLDEWARKWGQKAITYHPIEQGDKLDVQ
jgi:hypothetical protein